MRAIRTFRDSQQKKTWKPLYVLALETLDKTLRIIKKAGNSDNCESLFFRLKEELFFRLKE